MYVQQQRKICRSEMDNKLTFVKLVKYYKNKVIKKDICRNIFCHPKAI